MTFSRKKLDWKMLVLMLVINVGNKKSLGMILICRLATLLKYEGYGQREVANALKRF